MKIARVWVGLVAVWSVCPGRLWALSAPPLVQWSADGALMVVIVGDRVQTFDASGKPGKSLTLEGQPSDATLSPDASRLTFVIGGQQLWVLELATEAKVQIFAPSSSGDRCLSPRWSPNGQSLTFVVIAPGTPSEGQIHFATADGSRKSMLLKYTPW